VDLSGVIFVVLALAWAIYLIPKVLRHHDEVAKNRSVDKFSDSMRVLARREPVTRKKSQLVRADRPRLAPPTAREIRTRRRAAAHAAKRRRSILALLLFAGFVVTALALLGVLLPWAPTIPAVAILGFLVLSVSLGRRERQVWSLRLAMSTRSVPFRIEIPRPVPIRNEQGFEEVQCTDDTITFDPAELEAALEANGEGLWDPLPVTLPTYVTAPKATRAVRTIDLSAPGTYSSGHDADDSALVAQAQIPQQPDVHEVETQRAVGS
jgi:hypothetical protein